MIRSARFSCSGACRRLSVAMCSASVETSVLRPHQRTSSLRQSFERGACRRRRRARRQLGQRIGSGHPWPDSVSPTKKNASAARLQRPNLFRRRRNVGADQRTWVSRPCRPTSSASTAARRPSAARACSGHRPFWTRRGQPGAAQGRSGAFGMTSFKTNQIRGRSSYTEPSLSCNLRLGAESRGSLS